MLRLPICGFARRVDDTVARAMAILKSREDYMTRPHPFQLSLRGPKPRRFNPGHWERQQSVLPQIPIPAPLGPCHGL